MPKRWCRILSGALFVAALAATSASAETFTAYLNAAQEVPSAVSGAKGYGRIIVNESAGTLTFTVVYNGLSSAQTLAHIHAPAPIGANTGVVIDFGTVGGTSGTISGTRSITPTQIAQLRAGLGYINVHSANFPGGEIRGQLHASRPLDFDGDGRTDYSVLRFPNVTPPGIAQITYYNNNSTAGFQSIPWGNANTDFPAPGDYDGDTKDDATVYRAGATAGAASAFYTMRSTDGALQGVNWGVSGDQTVACDYDGDGKTDVAVFRRGASIGSPAYWYIIQSSNGAWRFVGWGTTGDITSSSGDTPVPSDYDGDGKCDIAVYRFGGLVPNNTYLILRSSDSALQMQTWGDFQTDYVAPGDFDGDGKTDFVAVRTGATGSTPLVWWILQSSNGAVRNQTFGVSSDRVTQGDYDGDGRTDISVFRPSGIFFSIASFTNAVVTQNWGMSGDFPTATYNAH